MFRNRDLAEWFGHVYAMWHFSGMKNVEFNTHLLSRIVIEDTYFRKEKQSIEEIFMYNPIF